MKLKTKLNAKEIRTIRDAIRDGLHSCSMLSPKSALMAIAIVIHKQPKLSTSLMSRVRKIAEQDKRS